ncbi:MAG: 5-formyltetrahydrofolate cyclo-ligase [Acidobacteriota bacterium]|nr:5-formyltetrahydrofolate cyclo-ligase [Acidobacteriota bacterium]
MNKVFFRKSVAAQRADLSPSDVARFSAAIGSRLIGNFDFGSVRYLHRFIPIVSSNEVDTTLILEQITTVNSEIRTVVPVVDKLSRELRHVEVNADTAFVSNEWGIPEPVSGDSVDEKSLDFVLVPLLCFDRRGHRVGYGGGYYDRFLAKVRPDCLKIGLSFFGPVDEIEDVHEGDIRLDYCVMPERIYDFSLTNDH